jgi:hypothetical protein
MPRKPKTQIDVATEAGREDAKISSGSQIRVHWLAMSRYTGGRTDTDTLRAAHLPYAKALFQALVNASSLTFRTTDGTTVTPRVVLEAGLRASYDIVLADDRVRVTKDDILRCLDIVLCAIHSEKATSIAVFSQADFKSSASDLLADLRDSPVDSTNGVGKDDVVARAQAGFQYHARCHRGAVGGAERQRRGINQRLKQRLRVREVRSPQGVGVGAAAGVPAHRQPVHTDLRSARDLGVFPPRFRGDIDLSFRLPWHCALLVQR